MTASTDLDNTLANIRARAEAASRGPWRWESWRDDLHHLIGRGGSPEVYEYDVEIIEPEHFGECGCRSACYLTNTVSKADREFIAHARTDVTQLLDLLDEQRAVIARVRDWLAAHPTTHDVRQTEGYWRAQRDLRALLDGADTTTTDGSEA